MANFFSRSGLTALFAGALAGSPAVAGQQQTPVAPDVQTLGPQVGARVPAFALQDQHGQSRTLDSLMGPNGLMLVFSRSADWCPYCKTQMVEMQGRVDDLARNGLGLAVVTYDPVPVLAAFTTRQQITFPMLSDPGSAAIKQYGILNTTVDANNPLFGYPFPGTFMLDRQGVVTARFFEPGYQERNTVSSLLVRLGNTVNVAGTKVSSRYLEFTTYATDEVAAAGTHFSVVIDATPAPRVHVYAPGVTGYKPIALTIHEQPGLVIREAQYPEPEIYHFEPLNEHVEVYQRPFRIIQDLLIDPSPAGQAALREASSVTINGTLTYQACDDKVCFNPQTVPLSWTVGLRPLDRERAKPQ